MSSIGVGETIELHKYYDNLSRREFLRLGAGSAAAGMTLPHLIERAYGASPEGVPIVHTRDIYDRPATVKIVAPERRRRLKVYERFSFANSAPPNIETFGTSIVQRSRDPTDLAIRVDVAEMPAKKRLPSTVSEVSGDIEAGNTSSVGIPLEFNEVGDLNIEQIDLEGGSTVTSPTDIGTATLVCYDRVGHDPVLLTAEHIEYGGTVSWNGITLDDIVNEDPTNPPTWYAMDGVTFDLPATVNYDLLGTISIPDVVGYWTFTGLSDATSGWLGAQVPANCYGDTSASFDGMVDHTHTDQGLSYAANTASEIAQPGDSGGPAVDDDGYLIGMLSANNCTLPNINCWTELAVAGPLFDAVNVTLNPDGYVPSK